MTLAQKEAILSMRQSKMTYAAIAQKLGLSLNTVKSICYRNAPTEEAPTDDRPKCKQCGQPIEEISKTRPRLFCCDACKVTWWNKHRGERKNANMLPHTCPTCGKVFMDYVGANRKFCSQACYRERSERDGQ